MKKILRKLRAFINRTFVADCPKCHKHFYGHNGFSTNTKIDRVNYRIICSKCAKEHDKKDMAG